MISIFKIGVIAVAASAAGAGFGYWLAVSRHRSQQDQRTKEEDDEKQMLMEVFFFPDSKVEGLGEMTKHAREQIYKEILWRSPSLTKMMDYLSKAESSLDVCMYHFTSYDLASAVLETLEKGGRVRLLCDFDCEGVSGSQVGRFRAAGAFVRTKRQQYIMHHKFAIIDGKTLVTGSFNWTMTAAMGNRENVIITDHVDAVKKFADEFERLWIEYAP